MKAKDVKVAIRVSINRQKRLSSNAIVKAVIREAESYEKSLRGRLKKIPKEFMSERLIVSKFCERICGMRLELKNYNNIVPMRRGPLRIDPSVAVVMAKCIFDNRSKKKSEALKKNLDRVLRSAQKKNPDYTNAFQLPTISISADWHRQLHRNLELALLQCSLFKDNPEFRTGNAIRSHIKNLSDSEIWDLANRLSYPANEVRKTKSTK